MQSKICHRNKDYHNKLYHSLDWLHYAENTRLCTGVSFNQPKLCPNATWNTNGITFADNNTIGANPKGIFISKNNTVYATNFQHGSIQIWLEGSASPTNTIVTNSSNSFATFVNMADDIYIDNGLNYRVDVWRENAAGYVSTLLTEGPCYGIFVDVSDILYCSLHDAHKVIKRSLNSNDTLLATAAGTGCPGYHPHMLYYPTGIFVTLNVDLYVADANNLRIQLFRSGQLNGITVAGRDAPGTIQLHFPKAVMFDGDGYLFILDSDKTRVIASGPDGFRCIIGCTTGWGSASDQLANPQSMAFDSYGNIFVVDTENHRVQKFVLSFNSCSKWTGEKRLSL